MPFGVTWVVEGIVTKTLKSVIKQCFVYQNRGYWLLKDALFVVLSICNKCRGELSHKSSTRLHINDFDLELYVLYGRMVIKVIGVLYHFLSFANTIIADKTHNMHALHARSGSRDCNVYESLWHEIESHVPCG